MVLKAMKAIRKATYKTSDALRCASLETVLYFPEKCRILQKRRKLGFPDIGQLMENAVYNELLYNGYQVSVGMVSTVGKDKEGKSVRKDYEIDFVARKGYEALYVQICQSVTDPNVLKKELRPFDFVRVEAKNVLVIGDPIPETRNQDGTYVVGIADFLLGL